MASLVKRFWIPQGLSLAILLLGLPLQAVGKTLTGTVQDPQSRVIVGAKLSLTCGGRTEVTLTDGQGRFAVRLNPSPEDCTLAATHPGFAPFRQQVSGVDGPLLIQLKLALNRQVVRVSPKPADLGTGSWASLTSVYLRETDLKLISNNTADQIGYAKALAGTATAPDAVYVDGLPANALPPAELVATIGINADPFSAEYADGDLTHIDITTQNPDRKFHFNSGGGSLGGGGHSILAPGLRSKDRSGRLGLTGPLPRLPVAFSIQTTFGYSGRDEPILAVLPRTQSPDLSKLPLAAPVRNSTGTVLFSVYYTKSENLRANFSLYDSSSKATNAGAGGETLPEAGVNSSFVVRETRGTITKTGVGYIYRGGVVVNTTYSSFRANSTDLGVTVLGSFAGGGAPIAESRSRRSSWTLKNVLQSDSARRFWTTGIMFLRVSDSAFELPNPAGFLEFPGLQAYNDALGGAGSGTWFLTTGNGHVRYASTTAAAFVEGELLRSENFLVRGGLRADYQTRAGVIFSPRLAATARARGFLFRAGAGVFVRDWPNEIFLRAIKGDGLHFQQYLVPNVSFADVHSPLAGMTTLVLSQVDSDLARPRNLMLKFSLERPLGNFAPGLEYTWTDGLLLLGSRRLGTAQGWMDLLESNRQQRKHELHAQLRYARKGQSWVAHYEWVRSYDNTDGPFSFPEQQDKLRAEWARSSGLPPHNFTLVGSFKLPAAVSLSLVATSRSSARYNFTSGIDFAHNGLFNDREGRPRNSGAGPNYSSLALYGYRRVPLPKLMSRSRERIYIDVGVQGDNLLGRKNYVSLGFVTGSPLFSKPLSALPGRSLRLWLNFDK